MTSLFALSAGTDTLYDAHNAQLRKDKAANPDTLRVVDGTLYHGLYTEDGAIRWYPVENAYENNGFYNFYFNNLYYNRCYVRPLIRPAVLYNPRNSLRIGGFGAIGHGSAARSSAS